MSMRMIIGGSVVTLVALGFVFPQLAQIRMDGVLGPSGVGLLFLGLAGTLGGVWCIVQGLRSESRPVP